MIKITLNQIAAKNPCSSGWAKILHARGKIDDTQLKQFLAAGIVPENYSKLADDEAFPLSLALESNGLNDTLWALRCLPNDFRLWRKYMVWCARKVQHLMKDQRSINALDVAWRHSDGLATDEELSLARRGAADDAYAAAADAARAKAVEAQKAKLMQILEAGHWVADE